VNVSRRELPSFIWFFSVIAFLPLGVLVVFLLRRYKMEKMGDSVRGHCKISRGGGKLSYQDEREGR